MTGPDGAVLWSYVADSPGDIPGVNLIFDALDAARGLSDLGSAPPEPGRHVRGPEGVRTVIVYGDYECPFCAAVEAGLHDRELRVSFRHFPVRSSHPRAQAAAQAAEAAALQGAFWPFHDALFADQGRLEDPHLWARAEALGLDVARFDADRRSDEVAGLRAGGLPVRDPRRGGHDADAVLRRRPARRASRRRVVGRPRTLTAAMPYTEAAMTGGDAQLIERMRGDHTGEAVRALYRTYSGELFGFALNSLGDRGQAEEIVQEVFTRAWRHAGSYDQSRGSVRTWLYQIARNVIIDARRRASVRPGSRCTSPPRATRSPSRRRSSRRCSAGRSSARSSASARSTGRSSASPTSRG